MKTCRKCGETKSLEDFHRNGASKDGHVHFCKPCKLEQNRQWREANPTYMRDYAENWRKASPTRKQESHLWHRYGLRPEDYARMLAEQQGQCPICGTPEGRLVVDHNHATGRVRELTCGRCNTYIGYVEKTPELLPRIVAYLEKHDE